MEQLIRANGAHIERHNDDPKPFVWTPVPSHFGPVEIG